MNGVSGSSRRSASTDVRLPKRDPVTWNGCGRHPVAGRSPHRPAPATRRRGPHRLDHLRDAVGDLVEGAREHAHLIAASVHLDAGAVQLPLERGRIDLRQRRGQIGSRPRQHRLHRPPHLEPHRAQAVDPVEHGDPGQLAGVSEQHQRPSRLARRHGGRTRDSVGDGRLQSPLAQVAKDQAPQELLLRLRGRREQFVNGAGPLGLGSRAGDARDPLQGGVHARPASASRRPPAAAARAARPSRRRAAAGAARRPGTLRRSRPRPGPCRRCRRRAVRPSRCATGSRRRRRRSRRSAGGAPSRRRSPRRGGC